MYTYVRAIRLQNVWQKKGLAGNRYRKNTSIGISSLYTGLRSQTYRQLASNYIMSLPNQSNEPPSCCGASCCGASCCGDQAAYNDGAAYGQHRMPVYRIPVQ